MSKLRSVNTHFWSDNYVIELDPVDKLLFLYLLTNEKTNMLGIYELHINRISFDTGVELSRVRKAFEGFRTHGKACYIEGYVVLPNFIKHQSFNTNMETSAIQSWNELPIIVRKDRFCKPVLKALKGLPKASEPIAEIEYELERELEVEGESPNPDGSEFPDVCEFIDEATEVAQYLLESICHYDPTHRYVHNTPSLGRWILDIERAMRLDKRTVKQLRYIIDWVYRGGGDFWAGNIESGEKLRNQFDKIKNQIRRNTNGTASKDATIESEVSKFS